MGPNVCMVNIGEKLEEARKRQGVSIREAAEATKVRSDVLLSFENNKFDLDLPEVYKRGFLKLYATYLKLDVERVMNDYNVIVRGQSKSVKRENLGHMELPNAQKTEVEGGGTPPMMNEGPKVKQPDSGVNVVSANPADTTSDVSLYWKVGVVFVGIFLLVGLTALLVNALSGPSESAEEIMSNPSIANEVEVVEPLSESQEGVFKIIAKDDVLNVMVRQDLDQKKLMGRSMKAGEEIIIEREGPVRVVSSDIDKITIELNGQRFNSPAKGIGQIPLGMNGPGR